MFLGHSNFFSYICNMKKVWNKQSEKDIFNEHVDWSQTFYAVIMKDLTEKVISTQAVECYDGSVNNHYDFIGDDSDDAVDFDEILLWRKIEDPYKKIK